MCSKDAFLDQIRFGFPTISPHSENPPFNSRGSALRTCQVRVEKPCGLAVLAPLQAASCTYRIALGPRAGRKVLSLQYAASRAAPITQPLCANAHGFSLHAGVRCAAEQRSELEHLCRYITRPAIANERLSVNHAGQVVLKLKTAYRNGTTHIVMSLLESM